MPHLVLADIAEHLVTDIELAGVQPDRRDHSGNVPAGDEREMRFEHRVQAAGGELPVHRVDAGRPYVDQYLTGSDLRFRPFLGDEIVRPAVGVQCDSPHGEHNLPTADRLPNH